MIAVFFDYFPVKLLPLGVLNDNVEALRCVWLDCTVVVNEKSDKTF